MDKTILVTGKRNALATNIVDEGLANKFRVLATIDPGMEKPEIDEDLAGGLHYMSWNARSPLSARSVLVHGVNTFGSIHEVIVIFSPNLETAPFHETRSAYFEDKIDTELKGYIFLLKEVLSYFQREGGGILSLVTHKRRQQLLSPLDACLDGAFKALVESIFTFYQNEPIVVRGFFSQTDQIREYARFILTGLKDKAGKTSGKWHKYSEKSGFFSIGR